MQEWFWTGGGSTRRLSPLCGRCGIQPTVSSHYVKHFVVVWSVTLLNGVGV